MEQRWLKKWDFLKNIKVEKLVFWGKWFARLKHENPELDWRVILITWWVVPGCTVDLKIIKKKRDFIEWQIINVVEVSPIEKEHPNNPYGMSGGWKWINIPYAEQLKIKETQVKEALFHLERYQENINFESIIPSPTVDWYRNKVEFSFWKYISNNDDVEEHFNVWFH